MGDKAATLEAISKEAVDLEGVSNFRSYPAGIHEVINYTKHRYNNPPVYITETGSFDTGTTPQAQAVNDPERVRYHYQHLSQLREAISEGADVRGYVLWSLLDDFEWSSGFTSRLGLYYVDQNKHLKRYARSSACWFKRILRV